MSTQQTASEATPNPFDDGIPFGTKLAELAEQRRDEPAVTVVALDGAAHSLTFGELDARANQWGRALATNGADTGSHVALAIPNSQHLMLATLGCWKIGAVPIPMHWDLPEWERNRVRNVIDPAVVVDENSRWALDARHVPGFHGRAACRHSHQPCLRLHVRAGGSTCRCRRNVAEFDLCRAGHHR